jgi:hypothetical protein
LSTFREEPNVHEREGLFNLHKLGEHVSALVGGSDLEKGGVNRAGLWARATLGFFSLSKSSRALIICKIRIDVS